MNAFENIVAQYLESEGYWVRQSVKVAISKEDKRKIGLPSMPTPEIDLVALDVKENELLLIEVKSLLESYGVWLEAVSGKDKKEFTKRYRLFNDDNFRKIVTEKLRDKYLQQGLIKGNTKLNYALAAGNLHSQKEAERISKYFKEKGWKLFSPKEIKGKISELSENKGWEDNLVTITAKLLLRD